MAFPVSSAHTGPPVHPAGLSSGLTHTSHPWNQGCNQLLSPGACAGEDGATHRKTRLFLRTNVGEANVPFLVAYARVFFS